MTGCQDSRLADRRVLRALQRRGAVLIEGPAHCGKSTLARRLATGGTLCLGPGEDVQSALEARVGDRPVYVQGWTGDIATWDAVANVVRHLEGCPPVILTFDGKIEEDKSRPFHAREIARVCLGTLTSAETGFSACTVSLADLLSRGPAAIGDAGAPEGQSRIEEELVRGGWPATQGMPLEDAAALVWRYWEDFARNAAESGEHAIQLGFALARATERPMTNLEVCRSVRPDPDDDFRLELSCFQKHLEASRVLELRTNWRPTRLLESRCSYLPLRCFADPSLAIAALGTQANALAALLEDRSLMRALFKNLVVRDVTEYARLLGASVWRYDDKDGRSIDIVIELDGRWHGLSVALDCAMLPEVTAKLVKTATSLEKYRAPKASTLSVVVGEGGAFEEDGVSIVPLGALCP